MDVCDKKKEVVRKQLEHLLVTHSLTQSISSADEIVVQYVLGILENLSCGEELDDDEEVMPFSEMMNAYLPGFSAISIQNLSVWMVDAADMLSKLQLTAVHLHEQPPPQLKEDVRDFDSMSVSSGSSCHSLPSPLPLPQAQPFHRERRRTVSSSEDDSGACSERRLIVVDDVDSESVDTLRDLCPAASVAELLHCLRVSGGNVQEAACLLLQRQESGMAITVQAPSARSSKKKGNRFSRDVQNEESLKDFIIAKYSFVDTKADKVEHRPELLHKDEKKMIRYREGQVVSTKGERFSEIKKKESEEDKKTYVSFKPQKKYRFH